MAECARTGCGKPAVSTPVLVLKAPIGDAEVAIGIPDLPHCADHVQSTKVSDLMDDAGWQSIVDQFRSRGMAEPVRASAAIKWDPIQ